MGMVSIALVALGLVGCAEPQQGNIEEGSGVTWEAAKAAVQAKTLEIVALIPGDQVVAVDQHETGSLFSCDEARHQWTGITYITLSADADIESITKNMETQLEVILRDHGEFEVTNRRDIFDDYQVTAESAVTSEAYLFGEEEPGLISIDSWSVCFTLPEGTYPGGSF